MYKEKMQITSNDVDQNLELKLSSLFRFLQTVASNHAESVGAGHWDLFEHNLLWVVLRMEVKIYRTPILDEVITVGTHPGDAKSFIYPRFYEVYDKKGKLIISASSMWSMIDKDTRRVVLKPQGVKTIVGSKDKDDLPLPEKVPGDATILKDTRKVRYSEIDLNGHLNNTQYIEFLLDTHEPEFYKTHRIKGINVNYDKEIRSGQVVSLYSNDQVPEVIKGKVDDTNHFSALVEYELR